MKRASLPLQALLTAVQESGCGTPRRIAAVRRFGRDRSEADMPSAGERDRSPRTSMAAIWNVVARIAQGPSARISRMPVDVDDDNGPNRPAICVCVPVRYRHPHGLRANVIESTRTQAPSP